MLLSYECEMIQSRKEATISALPGQITRRLAEVERCLAAWDMV